MFLLEKLESQIKEHPRRIVFTDGEDPRVMRAARKYSSGGFGVPILIGDSHKIKVTALNLNIGLEQIGIIDPKTSKDAALFEEKMQAHPNFQSIPKEKITELLEDPNYFGTMMLECGNAEALLSGASVKARSAYASLLELLSRNQHSEDISSFSILDTRKSSIGSNGLLFLTDTLLHPEPNDQTLTRTAVSSARICQHLLHAPPRIAMLGHTNHDLQTEDPCTLKMQSAAELTKGLAESIGLECEVAGEIQGDVALDSTIARLKLRHEMLGGNANVLVFPNLDAANITVKMLQVLSEVRTYGQILQGFNRAAGCISRSMQSTDIYGTAILLAYMSLNTKLLEPLSTDWDKGL